MKKLALILFGIFLIGCQQLPIGSNNSSGQSVWTGFLEGETLDVSPQVGGRLAGLAVKEGDLVQANQSLFAINDDLVQRRIEIADANVATAGAQVKLLEAGARPEDLALAQARVDQAQAALDAAEQGLTDAQALRDNPQPLLLIQAQAELGAQTAAQRLDTAVKQAQAADVENNFWQDQLNILADGSDVKLPDGTTKHFNTPTQRLTWAREQKNQAMYQAWEAWTAVTSAQAEKESADLSLQDIEAQIADPLALAARVTQAQAVRDRAAASVKTAQAALQVLHDGAGPAQIQAARAALAQAQAARASLDTEAAQYRVTVPQAGTVTSLFYREGEVVGPASAVVRLSIQGDLTLRVFVPMSQLPAVRTDQAVTLWLPDLDNRTASGKVSRIADQAEFTGRQPQTDSERNAQLVSVEIKISNPDSTIKAGMPASVSFTGEQMAAAALPTNVAAQPGTTFSGTLEERQTRIATELEGQVNTMRVSRGDQVKLGDVLLTLDDTTLKNALNEAQAAIRTAQANLDQVQEPARPGALALADAAVSQAQSELDSAQGSAGDSVRMLKEPQDLIGQAHIWEGKVNAAQADVARADAAISALQVQIDQAARDQSMGGKARLEILNKQAEATQSSRRTAQLTVEGSQKVVDLYRVIIQNPLDLVAAQHGAANQVKVAQAGLRVAQAEQDIARRGAQPEAVVLAQTRLSAAQASLKLVQAQAGRTSISSPIAGRVIDRQINAGETARPGVPLLTLADPRELELTLYVPVRLLSAVHLGQSGVLHVPSISGKTFDAQVTYIAPEAEFKPANIYNSQDRSEMVFAVRLTIPNASDELKAGLPADVTLQ
ncbi:MAG: efflux RND transporter periplasmic adaptor subunit [Anaerolineae bacterium]